MEILHTADWHIGEYKGPEQNGVNLRGQDIYRCLDALLEKTEQAEPDLIVVSGDIFNVAKLWSDRVLPEVAQAFEYLSRLGQIAPTVLLRGTPNHDGEGQYLVLKKMFRASKAVQIITEPQVLRVHTKAGPVSVAGLPGFDRGVFRAKFPGLDKEKENEFFTEQLGKIVMGLRAQCEPDIPAILLAHYTVPGANMENGQTAFLAQADLMLMPQVLDAAKFDLTALGHIHRPQRVASVSAPCFYSGAVDALTFNDEGQPRGFYLHDLEKDAHDFIPLPARQFQTIRLSGEDIRALNAGLIDTAAGKWKGSVQNKIVRVLYTCTDEEEKALDRHALEQALLLDGAWYVEAIMPVSVVETANKAVLPETGTPEENIRRYFEEKGYGKERIQKLMEAASPILAQAAADKPAASAQGRFEPVKIEVTNYRSYRQAAFDFSDISLCTVNGVNGAGKSSLFMDALLDALFEEPREGVRAGWVSDGAKSGSIDFTFRIGGRLFRVSRSRTKKSGKLTLNLAEQVKAEWVTRSKEKAADTQKAIADLLGLDSATLRSCALIMQDGYGLFLQADRETRMNILSVILGISVYEEMEEIAKGQLTELSRKHKNQAEQADNLAASLADDKAIGEESNRLKQEVKTCQAEKQAFSAKADALKIRLQIQKDAAARADKLRGDIAAVNMETSSLNEKQANQKALLTKAEAFLKNEPAILAGVQRYNTLLEKEKGLLGFKEAYSEKQKAVEQAEKAAFDAQSENELAKRNQQIFGEKRTRLATSLPNVDQLKKQTARLNVEQKKLVEMESAAAEYVAISEQIRALEKKRADANAAYQSEKAVRTTKIRQYQKAKHLLETAHCVDLEHAACSFLADAKKSAALYPTFWAACETWGKTQTAALQTMDGQIKEMSEKQQALHFDQGALTAQRQTVNSLSQAAAMLERAKGIRAQLLLLEQQEKTAETEVGHKADVLKKAQETLRALRSSFDAMAGQAKQAAALQAEIQKEAVWLEREKQLPVARERRQTAAARIAEITEELAKKAAALAELQTALAKEEQAAGDAETLQKELESVLNNLSDTDSAIQQRMQKLGALAEQLRANAALKEKIAALRQEVCDTAEQCVRMEDLKKAFSRDGIPHNIVKSVLPVLTDTANAILAQMSGGAMQVRFKTEKIVKGASAKEAETLDILIDDGQTERLYASESGGEKVKVSLAVILALSEIKNKRTGVQLGMLFIDEPPFLDADGTQAYCDALEAISRRDRDLKILSITHDPAMKARFPQSVEIVKDSGGSHVIGEGGIRLTA